MASPTTNKGYTYPAHGGAVNAWDTPIDADFDQIDLNVGGYYPITVSSSIAGAVFNSSYATVSSTVNTITPPTSIAQNLIYQFNGTINSSLTMLLPTVGSFYVVDNDSNSSGTGTLYVNTTGGAAAVSIPVGGSNLLYASSVSSNAINIVGQFAAKLNTSLGTPAIPGTAGTVAGSFTDTVWDATNKQLDVCVTTGTSTSAVFIPINPRIIPEGYLTLSTDANNPILTGDAAAKTAVYYTPLVGNWTIVSDGTVPYPYQFSQLSLGLTGSQAANNIYDVFLYNSTTASSMVIGTGPAWTNSGAGTGARGSGAGTTQLAKLGGVWTNAVQATLTNGASTYTCPVNQGVYLGSILVDASAGQVTCHRSYGQNRKWGVWNNYQRQKLALKAGDPTSSWAVSGSTAQPSNGSTGNSLQAFSGLAEEEYETALLQNVAVGPGGATGGTYRLGIGWNSTNAYSGLGPTITTISTTVTIGGVQTGQYVTAPSIGMQQAYSLQGPITGTIGTVTFYGTEANMNLTAKWRG